MQAVRKGSWSVEELAAKLAQLVEMGIRVDQVEKLVDRGQESCWVCGAMEQRGAMDPEPVGDELWWTCSRCAQRRQNAQGLKLPWPTDPDAWWRRYSAQLAAEGLSATAISLLRADAEELLRRDPTVLNLAGAVQLLDGKR